MKKSNKILLTYFLFALLAVTAVHVTLYAKYKRGEYVSFDKVREQRMDEIALPVVKYVWLTGLQRCTILPATSTKMKVVKLPGSRMKYNVVNDTLFITGDSVLTNQNMNEGRRGYQAVNLYLPGTMTINTLFTDLFLNGAPDSTSAQSYVINLYGKSSLNTGDMGNKNVYLNGLRVNAVGSTVTFDKETIIKDLYLQPSICTIYTKTAHIKHFQLKTDSTSTFTFGGNNFKEIEIVKE
jgi:hypothetical protein